MQDELNSNYWGKRYENGETGWDIGSVSPPLKQYLDQLEDKSMVILIPGAGNAYEAEYAHRSGFENTWVADLAPQPLENLKSRYPPIPQSQLLQADFFDLQGRFDLLLEQTFFCALHPSLRQAYARKAASLLNPGGKLVGVLFDDRLNNDRPPFGGSREEYQACFSPYFHFKTFETCYNSIKPREGREIFMILEKLRTGG